MPQVGWICPRSRVKVGWDHFDRECGRPGEPCGPPAGANAVAYRPAFSPFLARYARLKAERDVRHQGLDLTATSTMRCPRAFYLERTEAYWSSPTGMTAPTRGTALHEVMGRALDPAVWSTEATDPVRHDLRGTLDGVPISALADAWRLDLTEIVDAKFPKDWSVRFRKADAASPENTVQLNIERELVGQQAWAAGAGYDAATVRLTVWDHAVGATEGPVCQPAKHMTVDEIMATRPFDSHLTVRDHVALITQIQGEHAKLEPGDADGRARLAASVPLVGLPMFNGKACDICSVKVQCDELVRRHGRPV